MSKKSFLTEYDEYTGTADLDPSALKLITAATEILSNAYAPYSGFRVAASVLLENGEIVSGTNQENAAYPSGLCAERVALFSAASRYPEIAPVAIAIVAAKDAHDLPSPAPPCGACRQVMAETEYRFQKPLRVLFYSGNDRILSFDNVEKLLPVVFNRRSFEE